MQFVQYEWCLLITKVLLFVFTVQKSQMIIAHKYHYLHPSAWEYQSTALGYNQFWE